MSDHAVVDEETFSVSRTVHVRVPRDEVWAAITQPERIAEWFGDSATLPGLAVGTEGTLHWDDDGDFAFVVTAVVEDFLFEFRWAKDPETPVRDDTATTVRFTLADAPAGTVITVVESGFELVAGDDAARLEHLRGNREGWELEIDQLVTLLEGS